MPVTRNDRGQFIKGSASPSPGRPKRTIEVEFHNILVENVTPDFWRAIVQRAVADAIKGDKYAREFVANYTLGKAPNILELRAGDAALLADLLRRFESSGVSASDVFLAMLQQFADQDVDALPISGREDADDDE